MYEACLFCARQWAQGQTTVVERKQKKPERGINSPGFRVHQILEQTLQEPFLKKLISKDHDVSSGNAESLSVAGIRHPDKEKAESIVRPGLF